MRSDQAIIAPGAGGEVRAVPLTVAEPSVRSPAAIFPDTDLESDLDFTGMRLFR